MKARIDAELCSGHGRCWVHAPNVYQLDDNGYNADVGKVIDVKPGEEAAAKLGAESCPEAAIKLE